MNKEVKIIDIIMNTTSPLFTGEVREQDRKSSKVNFPVRKTANNKVIIPFKGALRSALEIMLKAKGESVCDTGSSGSRPCGRCVICSLFGSMQKKGRATVDFLISEDDHSNIVKDATHIRIDREKGSTSDSFRGEEVIEGADFRGRIIISNPTDRDVSLIESAFRYIEENGIGGWTNKGYGRVKIESNTETVGKDRFIS